MAREALHSLLRNATGPAHRSLESVVGDLDNLQAYLRYLRGIHLFREAIEPALASTAWPAEFGAWRPVAVADLARADLRDLGIPQPRLDALPVPALPDASSLVGVVYVIEGSALGARLILASARRLGLGEDHGARHLARQAGAVGSWPAFLAILGRLDGIDAVRMVDAANQTFRAAARALSVNGND